MLGPTQIALPPLCVDLDGTLVKTDTLAELALDLVREKPWYAFAFALWLVRGPAYLKAQIARRAALSADLLPYHEELLDYLRWEYRRERALVLATAANEGVARQVAAHLGIFSAVVASDAGNNLKGAKKLECLERLLGGRQFDYAGNASSDLAIWEGCGEAIIVGAPPRLVGKARTRARVAKVFPRPSRVRALVRALRPHQWVKNLLLFAPLLASHRAGAWAEAAVTLAGFVSFSLCASSVYVTNDLLDLKADRRHPTKRRRPFAAGDLDPLTGVSLAAALLAASALVAALLPTPFRWALALYYALTLAYSLRLKRLALLDVMTLSALYTVRLFAGGALTGIWLSHWLLIFSMFLFTSLALVKRLSELRGVRERRQTAAQGRGYLASDLDSLAGLGVASGYCAALIFVLYLSSETVKALYSRPQWLWPVTLLFFYWISRVWLLAQRGAVDEDPIVFALKDKVSYALGGLAAVCWLAAL
jgi:4-hydroxybenzoate polyprenyltransferase